MTTGTFPSAQDTGEVLEPLDVEVGQRKRRGDSPALRTWKSGQAELRISPVRVSTFIGGRAAHTPTTVVKYRAMFTTGWGLISEVALRPFPFLDFHGALGFHIFGMRGNLAPGFAWRQHFWAFLDARLGLRLQFPLWAESGSWRIHQVRPTLIVLFAGWDLGGAYMSKLDVRMAGIRYAYWRLSTAGLWQANMGLEFRAPLFSFTFSFHYLMIGAPRDHGGLLGPRSSTSESMILLGVELGAAAYFG
jgi:hypothetical protein